MNKRSNYRTLGAGLLGALAVTVAGLNAYAAEEPRRLSVKLGVGAMHVDAPTVEGLSSAVNNNATATIARQPRPNATDIEETDVVGLIGLDIPLNPRSSGFDNVSLIVEGSVASFDDDSIANDPLQPDPGGMLMMGETLEIIGIGTLPFAGGNGFGGDTRAVGNLGFIGAPGQIVTTQVDGDMDYWEVRGILAGDLPSRNFGAGGTVTPRVSFGLIAANLDQNYNIRQDARQSGFANFNHQLNEEVDATYIGPAIGLNYGIQPPNSKATFHLFGELAALHADAELTARQRVEFGAPAGAYTASRKDHETAVAGRVNLGLGLDYDFGLLTLGAEGSFTYWSYVPQIQNPVVPSNQPLGTLSRPLAPKIKGDDTLTSQVLVTAKIPIR